MTSFLSLESRYLGARARSYSRAVSALGVMIVLTVPSQLSASYFRRLGGLPGAASQYSVPWDISADGTVVVGESNSANGVEAFRWTLSEGIQGLGGLGGDEFFSTAYRVSADGLVVIGSSISPLSGERTEAFRWTASEGMVGLGDLSGGEYSSSASGVSTDGSVITGTSTSFFSPSTGECFRWTQGAGIAALGGLPGVPVPTCVPRRANLNGAVIVGWSTSPEGRQAFRWTEAGGMIGLGDLPAGFFDSSATDVSDDGLVVVGNALNPGQTAFRWTMADGMVDLGRPPGASLSGASSASADGSIVVGDAGVGGDLVPSIWDATNGMRSLVDVLTALGLTPQTEGWDLEQATAVSSDGLTVVGWGFNPDGDREAWLAYLGEPSVVEIPTTSTMGLVLLAAVIALVSLAVLRFRRRARPILTK